MSVLQNRSRKERKAPSPPLRPFLGSDLILDTLDSANTDRFLVRKYENYLRLAEQPFPLTNKGVVGLMNWPNPLSYWNDYVEWKDIGPELIHVLRTSPDTIGRNPIKRK